MSNFSALILAAGKGTRMNSPLPKVLHPVAGVPMIARVVKAAKEAGATEVRVVTGVGSELVQSTVEPMGAVCHRQERPLGTADAVRSASVESLRGEVIVLNGDHPLLEASDIATFREQFSQSKASVAVVTCELPDPGPFGRIVRHQNTVRAIVEAKDASHETLKIREINTGIYLLRADVLQNLLPKIKSHNAQGEYYLTDIVALAVEEGLVVEGFLADARVALGVNTQIELAKASAAAYRRKAELLMANGVMMIQPESTFVEDTVTVAGGSVLYPQVFLRGKTQVGAACVIEPGCVVTNSTLGEHVHLKAGCYLDDARVSNQAQLGPYAHLRPGTEIGENCKVGNFVEMKKVKFGPGAKASHLTYLGDAEVGANTNIGCGVITCNYAADHKKYPTKIGQDVFVGSDCQFVAPVTIGDGAVIGSGSTITKDVPGGALAVARGRQIIKENYNPGAKKKE
ncbi:MAG: bifunctional UDP-N-acetylglucosamine diphosphorylase/glucosamine-1-phosphate N-acetyltransferase GlmU [Bdellovibrionales bacterium]